MCISIHLSFENPLYLYRLSINLDLDHRCDDSKIATPTTAAKGKRQRDRSNDHDDGEVPKRFR